MFIFRFVPMVLIAVFAATMNPSNGRASDEDGQFEMRVDGAPVNLFHPYGYCSIDEQNPMEDALVDQVKASFDFLGDDYIAVIYDCQEMEAYHDNKDNPPNTVVAYGIPKPNGHLPRQVRMNVERFKEHLRATGYHEKDRQGIESALRQMGFNGEFQYFSEIDWDLYATYSAMVVDSDLVVTGLTVIRGKVIKIVVGMQLPGQLDKLDRVLTILVKAKFIAEEMQRINR